MPASGAAHALDANVILRHILADDAVLAAKAHGIFAAMASGELVLECDPVSLSEAVWVLSSYYSVPDSEIADSLRPILMAPGLHMPERQRYLRALDLLAAGTVGWGDACACATALDCCDGRLFSFDRALSRVAGVDRTEAPGSR